MAGYGLCYTGSVEIPSGLKLLSQLSIQALQVDNYQNQVSSFGPQKLVTNLILFGLRTGTMSLTTAQVV